MWRYVAPCRGPEISGGPGRLSSGTAAGSAALPSHCFASGGIFSGNRAAFRVPVPEYAPAGGTGGIVWRGWRSLSRVGIAGLVGLVVFDLFPLARVAAVVRAILREFGMMFAAEY